MLSWGRMKCPILISLIFIAITASDDASAQGPEPQLVRAFTSFGEEVGTGGIVASTAPGLGEFFVDADFDGPFTGSGSGSYWYALRFDNTVGDYIQSYVSPVAAANIVGLDLADLHGSAGEELVICYEDGILQLHHQQTKELLGTIDTGIPQIESITFANLDNVGLEEIVLLDGSGCQVFDATGTALAQYPTLDGVEVIAGQMDADPGLEIATTNGEVMDFQTGLVQASYSLAFGHDMVLLDFDSDGMQELLFSDYSGYVRAFDVDSQSLKWSYAVDTVDSITVGDSDLDGVEELIVAEASTFDDVFSLNPMTLVEGWSYRLPETGADTVTLADFDQDGAMEVLWVRGNFSTAADVMIVMDPSNQSVEWESLALEGPFASPEMGDLDGDGIDEIVSISFGSGSHDAPRIMVLEQTGQRTHVSPETMRGYGHQGAYDVHLHDFDGDGDLEILVGGNVNYSGIMEIYDYYPGGVFNLVWDNSVLANSVSFHRVDAADLDGDGTLEVIGAVGSSTGTPGSAVYVYDLISGNLEWRSLQMGSSGNDALELTHGDFDGDGALEIAALIEGGYVYVFASDGTLEAVILGDFLSMRPGPDSGGARKLLLGTENGDLEVYAWNGTSYPLTRTISLGLNSLDGFTLPTSARAPLFLSEAGHLQAHRLGSAQPLWRSGNYGDDFGQQVHTLQNGDIVTGGSTGLYFFGIR